VESVSGERQAPHHLLDSTPRPANDRPTLPHDGPAAVFTSRLAICVHDLRSLLTFSQHMSMSCQYWYNSQHRHRKRIAGIVGRIHTGSKMKR
jgi:hypothetical protein